MILNTKIPFNYILRQVKRDLFLVGLFTALIYLIDYYAFSFSLPLQIPAFLGTAISLVLAFKINQSYDRWWEGRKIWGAIVNDSRSLVLQLVHFASIKNIKKEDVKIIAYRQIAWCYALGKHLRKLNPMDGLDEFLPKDEIEALTSKKHIPLEVMNLNMKGVTLLRKNELINDFQNVQIDNSFVRLCASMGQAERIKNTVFPITYRMYLHFSIYVFLFSLTLSITDLQSIFEIPLMMIISLPFFLLEKTSYHLQDPFENRPTDTPVNSIARNIEINIKQILDEDDLPQSHVSNEFYIM